MNIDRSRVVVRRCSVLSVLSARLASGRRLEWVPIYFSPGVIEILSSIESSSQQQ